MNHRPAKHRKQNLKSFQRLLEIEYAEWGIALQAGSSSIAEDEVFDVHAVAETNLSYEAGSGLT